jgi:SAM-dependent methyltransferase
LKKGCATLATSETIVSAFPPGTLQALDEVLEEGRRRLHPSVFNPNFLVLRARRQIFEQWFREFDRGGLAVLDVGGRIQPYRALLGGRVGRYFAIDPLRTALVNVVGDGEHLPFASDSFDLIFCTQVLGYIRRPEQVIEEIHRVLKPGGMLLLSAPALSPSDSDEEYWCFYPAGLRALLAPFSKIEIAGEGGSITGVCRTVNAGLNTFAKYRPIRYLLRATVFPVVNIVGLLMERLAHSDNQQFTPNYSVRAQK